MSKYKILYQISGSIAAYKSATVLSKLVQSGFEVQTVATPSALKFIGNATLEGLTGKPVLSDMYAPGQLMDHINLIKWADLVILAPATANTINRMAQGLADDLIGALFLAHDWAKPYLLAPAMNTKMFQHPATRSALATLKAWGVQILPTAEGYLACGDEGQGKMLAPEDILQALIKALPPDRNRPRVLISSGGTREAVDAVRFVGNISSGLTGSALADALIRKGAAVTFLYGPQSHLPSLVCELRDFQSSADLEQQLQTLLSEQDFDVLIHLAAVSDFIPSQLDVGAEIMTLPLSTKLSSHTAELGIRFQKRSKIIKTLKAYSRNPELRLVAFKLTVGATATRQQKAVKTLFQVSSCDLVVANDMQDRPGGRQSEFQLFRAGSTQASGSAHTVGELSELLVHELFNKKEIIS